MVFRFIILSDEVESFRRDICIDSEASFLDLHNAIIESVGFKKEEMASFFICDDDWAKKTEITLFEMDSESDEDNFVMESTHLGELLEDERQKLLYVFEYLTERSFFMELREIIPGKNLEKWEVVRSDGEAPQQISLLEEIDFNAPVITTVTDDIFDEDIDLDQYDEEDFGGLVEGNPFDNY
ncbi:plasmid pRiA4b ORF-3 family protein [Bacteroidales bacterium OttesenSCG-928-I14]|nr:plasmid pRiA4b ORF-3 family protein [Bacteroidales bacterium OttesenSCG-928-I14]